MPHQLHFIAFHIIWIIPLHVFIHQHAFHQKYRKTKNNNIIFPPRPLHTLRKIYPQHAFISNKLFFFIHMHSHKKYTYNNNKTKKEKKKHFSNPHISPMSTTFFKKYIYIIDIPFLCMHFTYISIQQKI